MTSTSPDVAPATAAGAGVHAARTKKGRLEFLDTLRGIAALVVALQHTGEVLYPRVLAFSETWWRPGEFGVIVFFVCSGFIIPASMERRGDLREFWIGRAFRLFPLYLTVLVAALLLFGTPWVAGPANYHVVVDSAINATMLQVFTPRPIVIGASWTLGYEMVFYLLMTVLFMIGWHKKSAGAATGLYLTALIAGGTLVPFFLIQPQIRSWPAVVIGLLVLACVVVLPRVRGTGARSVALTISMMILLLLLDRPHDLWFSFLLLASMFVGTTLYRYDIGTVSRRTAAFVFGFAIFSVTLVEFCYQVGVPEPTTGATPRWWTEAGTFVSAYLLFGALFLLRRFSFPKALVYLGTISYSVYLMHALVLLLPRPHLPRPALWAAMLAVTLVLSMLTYRFIERPGQAMGRRVIGIRRRRADARQAASPVYEFAQNRARVASPSTEAAAPDRSEEPAADSAPTEADTRELDEQVSGRPS